MTKSNGGFAGTIGVEDALDDFIWDELPTELLLFALLAEEDATVLFVEDDFPGAFTDEP